MKKQTRFLCAGLLAIGSLWGCGSGKQPAVQQKQVQAPSVSRPKNADQEIDQLIAKAREFYFLGERELSLGHLEKAKQQFDASLDLLMNFQSNGAPNARVEAVVDELQEKIFQHEMAALKAGDGFTENPLEPALIDDLKNINTFPSADKETKAEVEEDLQNTTYDIPVEVNDNVLSFIRIFQNSRRKEFVGGLVRSGRYIPLMKQIFREEGLPEDLVYTALIESSFKSNAYSHARAKGFWQFISGTAKRYDLQMDWWVDERSDFEKSTRAAARYLKDLHGMFGDWYLALAGYNAGENKIVLGIQRTGAKDFWQLARTSQIRQETKNYVPAILAGMIIAKDPKKYGFEEDLEEPIEYDPVNIDYTVDLRLVAECSGAPLEEIKLLNPELGRMTTPPRTSYTVRVPKGKSETFIAEIASIPSDKRITWRKHEVREGETLSSIAAVYRTTPGAISSVNSFASGSNLAAGQKVIIPIGRSSQVSYSSKSTFASGYGQLKKYTVRAGDTLFRIATKFGATVEQLCSWNGFSKSHILRPGESLAVHYGGPTTSPSRKIVYKVKKGDTLYQIASNYNIDVDSLRKWNNNKSQIHPGDRLTIYSK